MGAEVVKLIFDQNGTSIGVYAEGQLTEPRQTSRISFLFFSFFPIDCQILGNLGLPLSNSPPAWCSLWASSC